MRGIAGYGEMLSEEKNASLYASQMRDGHLFLSDEMALKYRIDAMAAGWTRLGDLSGWRSPYINPWTVIHKFETIRIAVCAAPPQHGDGG